MARDAGMLAFSIILVEFVLSGRFQSVSGRIGIDLSMRFHQLFARTALVLALLHPFLYRAPFNPPLPWDPTRQLSVTVDLTSLWTGIAAWILLPLLILTSIGRERLGCSYEAWRLMHGLGAVLIAAALLHHTLSAGRYSQDPVLAGLWVVLFFIAVSALAFVYILKPISQIRKPWRVQGVRPLGLKTWELTLTPVGHRGLSYEAGHFVWLNVGNSPFSLYENPFSISSAPASGKDLQFVIKEQGDFTRAVSQIEVGTIGYVDGPHGNLALSGRDGPGVALIAGGVGIAPLLGILRQLRLEEDRRPTLLIYGNRVQEQILYADELEAISRERGTRIVHVLSQPPEGWTGAVGMVDANLIRSVIEGAEMKDWVYILCGPPPMMEVVEDTLIELGVPARKILSERFNYD